MDRIDISNFSQSPPQVKARALIMRDGMLLCQKKQVGDKVYLTLPGGTQEPNESLEKAVIRECAEEIGTTVIPNDMTFVFAHHTSISGSYNQKIECVFSAAVASDYQPKMGPAPDKYQVDVLWVNITELDKYVFLLPHFVEALQSHLKGNSKFYWPADSAMNLNDVERLIKVS